jgi:tetratricopeptide (TPR) repeat protein
MLQVTKGWAAPETIAARERTAVLAEKSGRLVLVSNSLASRAFTAFILSDLRAAGALADQSLELALRTRDRTMHAYRYMLQLAVHHFSGDFVGAETHFAAGLTFFNDPAFKDDPVGGFAAVFGIAAWNAWMLGRVGIARERAAKLMAAVNETKLCEKHHFPNEAASARCILGEMQTHLGCVADGIALILQGTAELLKIGCRVGMPGWMTSLADAQQRAGAMADALETVERTLDFSPVEIRYRPETLRVRGEIRLSLKQSEHAEADFRESIALAQKMGAKAWELRATTSLARLLYKQGQRDEARAMLADIYGWFTEGFDTADLKDAKALLDELSV